MLRRNLWGEREKDRNGGREGQERKGEGRGRRRERELKGLLHVIFRAGKSEICKTGLRAGDPSEEPRL